MKAEITSLILLLIALSTPLHAQAPSASGSGLSVAEYCQKLANGNERADALERTCEFSLSLQKKLPNYICDENITRWADSRRERRIDVIDAQVTVEAGKDSYSNIRINGKPTDKPLERMPGMLSAGEFGMQWPSLFAPENEANFTFKKEVKLNFRPTFLFSFEVREGENKSFNVWDLYGREWNPGYKGSV